MASLAGFLCRSRCRMAASSATDRAADRLSPLLEGPTNEDLDILPGADIGACGNVRRHGTSADEDAGLQRRLGTLSRRPRRRSKARCASCDAVGVEAGLCEAL